MDVGAGSGADSAWFSSLGHEVLAVEPTFELRRRAMELHPSPRITLVDDCLPHLRSVAAVQQDFELIVVAGVWTHLDELQRSEALRTLTSLMTRDGAILVSIRQGRPPASGDTGRPSRRNRLHRESGRSL